MREIKFRAWDKEQKELITSQEMNGGKGSLALFFDYVEEDSYQDDFILMQYTGLKDKNGKEIYDGDILKCTKLRKPFNCSVGYDEGCYNYNTKRVTRELWRIVDYCEVIGNIYENPELVK